VWWGPQALQIWTHCNIISAAPCWTKYKYHELHITVCWRANMHMRAMNWTHVGLDCPPRVCGCQWWSLRAPAVTLSVSNLITNIYLLWKSYKSTQKAMPTTHTSNNKVTLFRKSEPLVSYRWRQRSEVGMPRNGGVVLDEIVCHFPMYFNQTKLRTVEGVFGVVAGVDRDHNHSLAAVWCRHYSHRNTRLGVQ